jgi:hypothetical protein
MTIVEKWAIAGTIATILYTFLTYRLLMQNKKINETNNKLAEFQIYNEIAKLLSTDNAKAWVEKCRNKTILVTEETRNKICYELLNPLEDLAKFWEDKLVTIESINSGFGLTILVVGNNDKIAELIKSEKSEHEALYTGIESLYMKIYSLCNEVEKKKFKDKII